MRLRIALLAAFTVTLAVAGVAASAMASRTPKHIPRCSARRILTTASFPGTDRKAARFWTAPSPWRFSQVEGRHSGRGLPEIYRNRVFIAEHGSWNRSDKSGYRITVVTLDGNRAVAYEPFATGFYTGDEVHGRPVDLLEMPDGSLLVSDETSGATYRISYSGAK